MVICPVYSVTVPDISTYCLACGKLNHVPLKTASGKSGKRVNTRQVKLSGGGGTGGVFGG
jgi:hypothetical protein